MCSNYQGIKEKERLTQYFGVQAPAPGAKADLWPGYLGVFIRRHPQANTGDEAVGEYEALNGLFGLVPHWATDTKLTKSTYNARSETVAIKPSFRDAWKRAQHCIIPAEAFYEPDWRSGRAIPTRIESADGTPMGIAGIWSCWKSPKGESVFSYSMLTINADDHELMNHFHKPADEKRMVVILPQNRYADWLAASEKDSAEFLMPYPAKRLRAVSPATTTPALFA